MKGLQLGIRSSRQFQGNRCQPLLSLKCSQRSQRLYLGSTCQWLLLAKLIVGQSQTCLWGLRLCACGPLYNNSHLPITSSIKTQSKARCLNNWNSSKPGCPQINEFMCKGGVAILRVPFMVAFVVWKATRHTSQEDKVNWTSQIWKDCNLAFVRQDRSKATVVQPCCL